MLGAFELGSSSVGSAEGGASAPAGVVASASQSMGEFAQSAAATITTGVSASASMVMGSFAQTSAAEVTGLGGIVTSASIAMQSFSHSSTAAVTTPSIAGEAVKTPAGGLLASYLIPKVSFVRVSDMTVVLNLTNQTTNASGLLPISSTNFVAGTNYIRLLSDSTGANVGARTYTAAP